MLQGPGLQQQQGADLTRARIVACTRQATDEMSKTARLHTTALKRQQSAEILSPQAFGLLPQAMTTGQAQQKPCGRKLRGAPSRRTVQISGLQSAAWEAQQAQNKAQRASALEKKRSQTTEACLPPAKDGCIPCLQMPSPAAAERPACRPKVRLCFSKPVLSTADSAPAAALSAARKEPPSSPETPEPRALMPSLGSMDDLHPRAPRVRSDGNALP